MPIKKHIIVYSHGFGVQKDDRGLLTDIAKAIPEVESVLFDYFEVDEDRKTLATCPPSAQVEKINHIIEDVKKSNPGAIIDLICHSQGTIIAAMAKPEGVRMAILLAPVFDMDLERTLARYRGRPDADINLRGTSKLPPLDGLIRIVPSEYWEERIKIQPFREYNAFVEKTETIVINANQDEVLPKVDLSELSPKIKLTALDGDHNFNGPAREALIQVIRGYIL